jgi:hypothetical protein
MLVRKVGEGLSSPEKRFVYEVWAFLSELRSSWRAFVPGETAAELIVEQAALLHHTDTSALSAQIEEGPPTKHHDGVRQLRMSGLVFCKAW